jgi:hypothetical protein
MDHDFPGAFVAGRFNHAILADLNVAAFIHKMRVENFCSCHAVF